MPNKIQSAFDVCIIGAGPIGLYAAYLACLKNLKTVLLESTNLVGGQLINLYPIKEIHDFPTYDSIVASDLITKLNNQLKSIKGLTIIKNSNITKIDKTKIVVNSKIINFKYLIIATGNGHFMPNLLECQGSKQCNKIDYVVSDINKYKNKKVLILGGGHSVVDWANTLKTSHITNDVTIIHRRNELRAIGNGVNELYKNKINLILDANIIKINKNVLTYSKDKKNIDINFDNIIVQYGAKVNQDLFNNFSNLKIIDSRIKVDQNNKTSIDNVYAIGNACYYKLKPYNIITGMGEAYRAIFAILSILHPY